MAGAPRVPKPANQGSPGKPYTQPLGTSGTPKVQPKPSPAPQTPQNYRTSGKPGGTSGRGKGTR